MLETDRMKYWDKKEKLVKYTEGARRFFPLAEEQLQVIGRIIDKFSPGISSFLDLGCGDGFMGRFIQSLFLDASAVFLDISGKMIEKARAKDRGRNSIFVIGDFGKPGWKDVLEPGKKFDLVISGYSIHHISNREKQRLYRDIYGLLKDGGLFLNLDHVSSSSDPLEDTFNELFLDAMSEYHKRRHEEKSMEEIRSVYYDPEHKKLNKLEAVEVQCKWLRETGFSNVDCYLKIMELALFGGTKENI